MRKSKTKRKGKLRGGDFHVLLCICSFMAESHLIGTLYGKLSSLPQQGEDE